MAKYRNKTVVEAEQFILDNKGISRFPAGVQQFVHGFDNGVRIVNYGLSGTGPGVLSGDWVITEPDGTQHVCKPDVFEATYEPA